MDALVAECFAQTVLCRLKGELAFRAKGVPPMGAFDPWSLEILKVLCGGIPASAVETSARLTLSARTSGSLVVVGPGSLVSVAGRVTESPCRVAAREGDIVVVHAPPRGRRSLVTPPSGWNPPLPFGAANCQGLSCGQTLAASKSPQPRDLRLDPGVVPGVSRQGALVRIVGQPFESRSWTVSTDSDRRGVRLLPDIRVPGPPGLGKSAPCFVGTCQLTPEGTLLIHGPDGPTIGGYAQVGVVCAADMGVVAQLRPGDRVTTEAVTIEQALCLEEEQVVALTRLRVLLSLAGD